MFTLSKKNNSFSHQYKPTLGIRELEQAADLGAGGGGNVRNPLIFVV